MIKDNRINFDGQTLFKVLRNESLVIPDVIDGTSPTSISSGLSPATLFNTKRAAVGGALVFQFNDAAGPTQLALSVKLNPGDTVAVSNANPAVVTVTPRGGTAETVASIANTSVAGVIGFYA